MGTQSIQISERRSRLEAIIGTIALTVVLVLVSVYLFGEYGAMMFIGTPFLIGMMAPIIYGRAQQRTRGESYKIGFITLTLTLVALLVFAIEGLICLVMASPIVGVLAVVGVEVGYLVQRRMHRDDRGPIYILPFLVLILPVTLAYDLVLEDKYQTYTVLTEIEIDAPREVVWDKVIHFSPIAEPDEWLFKVGIAYPLNANIEGTGVGAIRYCNFTTGSFVEPITVWNEPRELAFTVEKQPIPMTELSPYTIEPHHLHGYFVSTKGQFLLEELPGDRTLLKGTTWYYNKMRPEFYWSIWSDHIIRSIHNRVMKHVKQDAETAFQQHVMLQDTL